jgi:activator of HSP90 ATPase
MADGREVKVSFVSAGDHTTVAESFETEQTNSVEVQRTGWQSILNNFGKYVETSDKAEILHFEISINAPVEKVYKAMLDEKTYSAWTSVFNPASRFVGSWKKGSRIQFLGTDQDGSLGGMISRIKENIPNRFVSIEHLGMVKDGKEIMNGADIKDWAGALENYSFSGDKEHTLLSVEMDVIREFKEYFLETWPKALKNLKTICES